MKAKKRSLVFIMLCMCHYISFSVYAISPFEKHPQDATVIYLRGTCSSGKSTLIRSIVQECDLELVDEDSIMQRSYLEAVALRFPCKFIIINKAVARENLYHALREKDILFKKTASLEDSQKAKNALCEIQEELNNPQNLLWKKALSDGINTEVIQRLKEAIERRKNVILDSWYVKEHHIQELFPNVQIIRVLLYCSLPVAYNRLLKRNEEAIDRENLQEKRYLRQLFGSFTALYQISDQPLQPIHSIYRHELDQVFDAILLPLKDIAYQKPIFTFEEITRPLFMKMKMAFLQPFDECKSENLYIAPKNAQDVIIDNTSNNIQNAVHSLKKALSKQKS